MTQKSQWMKFPLIEIKLDEKASGDGPAVSDVQLLRVGTFYHERYGEVKITPTILSDMVKNWKNNVRKIDLAIDYKHESEDIAAGWMKKVYLSDDGQELWSTVSWTPRGRKVLSDKEFRYLSADFNFDYQDNETLQKYGPTLLGAGLTNRPVIKAMEPAVELTEVTYQEGKDKMAKADAGKQGAGDQPDMDARMAKLEEQMSELAKGQAKPADAADAPASKKVVDKSKAGKTELADGDDIMALLKDLSDRVAALEKGEEGEDEMSEVKPPVKGKSDDGKGDDAAMAEKETKFNLMLSEGKVVEAQRKSFLKGDMMKFAELGKDVKLSTKGHGHGGEDDASGDVQDIVLKRAQTLLSEKKVKTLGEGISKTLSENSDLRKKYEAQ